MKRPNDSQDGPALRERFGSPEAILDVLQSVREALHSLLLAVNVDPTKGRETARQLNLDRNLVWRVARVISADDILAVTRDIPSRNHVEKICAACRDHGAPEAQLERARAAVTTFERVVDECAGNREYFEAMVSGLVHDDVTHRQENARKLTFLGNLALWGVQARVDFKSLAYKPSETNGDLLDVLRLGGLVDFRRSHRKEWPIHRAHSYSDDGSIRGFHGVPLDDTEASSLAPLVTQLCSKPVPELIQVETEYGFRFDLPAGEFGNAGALTCVFGDILRDFGNLWREDGKDEYCASMNDLYTPSELVVHDVFLHLSLALNATPDVMVLDRLSMPRGFNPRIDDEHRMPLSSKILRVSAGPGGSHLTQYPEYSRLLQYALGHVGWRPEEFQGYRFVMTYPPVPSAVVMRSPLPERPRT